MERYFVKMKRRLACQKQEATMIKCACKISLTTCLKRTPFYTLLLSERGNYDKVCKRGS